MELIYILKNENIDVKQLEKGLRVIGLSLSRFEKVREEQIPDLVSLFKIAVNVGPHKTAKFTKMDLRSKFEKVIRGQLLKNANDVVKTDESLKPIDSSKKESSLHPIANSINQNRNPIKNKEVGRVRFFDISKGFGYVQNFHDQKDCFIHKSKLLTPSIKEDDIVVFETINSTKKPGNLDAIQVSKNIPVYIFNKEITSRAFAIPLAINLLDKEVRLAHELESGFSIVCATYKDSSWKVTGLSKDGFSKNELRYFAPILLNKFLSNIKEYRSAYDSLVAILNKHFNSAELELIYNDIITNLEKKTIAEIGTCIKNISSPYLMALVLDKNKTLSKISFVLWDDGISSKLPLTANQNELIVWFNEILPFLSREKLQETLLKILNQFGPNKLLEESYEYLIHKGWIIDSRADLLTVISFLRKFRSSFPSIKLSESDFLLAKNDFYGQLFQEGILIDLSEKWIRHYIEGASSIDEKARFIEKLPPDKILYYYSISPVLYNYRDKYIASILEGEFSKIDCVCFDIESDGERISEFAWITTSGGKCDSDFKNQEQGISELVNLINSGVLVIGQNIKKFDLQILADYGASPSNDFIWDTLEVEMLLNPHRFSYGLITKHHASSDAEVTLRIFRNQLARIVASESDYISVKDLLPFKALDIINRIAQDPNWKLLNHVLLEQQSNEFYRPNPTNRSIPEQTLVQLSERVKEGGKKVIIAPELLWSPLSQQFDLDFYSMDGTFRLVLSQDKIESNLDGDKLLKAILLRFVESCHSKGLQPYFHHLPIAVQLRLNTEQAMAICDSTEVDFSNLTNKPICIKPADIESLRRRIDQIPDLRVIVLGNELYELTSKLQLGQDLDFVTIFDRLKNEPIWLQMSGGKSCISINQSNCRQLGISEFPKFIQNIWLEKVGRGKFRAWCNLNLEAYINDLQLKDVEYINWVDESLPKLNSYIVRPDPKKSGYIGEQKRVNPESLYRKSYWVYQFKLFEGIGNATNPKVLIVNDELESEKLRAYARRKGYFIPDTNATLARQIELLHSNGTANKLLVATFHDLDKVISSNYIGPLDFIWDSFLLQEKIQMLKGKISNSLQSDEEQKEDDYQTNINLVQRDYDLFSLIKLHKALIDCYYKMIYDNNQDSQLFLCDTRLTDYYGIEKSLNLNAKSVKMWFNEEEYVKDKAIAGDFFSSDHEIVEPDFNIDEAKEILRQIFLVPLEGGTPNQWYDYQHPCLDEILDAKKDLLISLPTGAGKSVLFQGPALFRSAFSCKLTIVISPLRALMQDQVDALWNKGFYSNVDFLSSDKSHVEIRDIYRRVSGGELTLLYITPERFRSRSFENCLLSRLDADSGFEYVVFDEAHCISQWGQEFRPDYFNAGRKVSGYSGVYQMRKLLFSATISEQVFGEITTLIPGVVTVNGAEKSYNPVRDHISMNFKHNLIEVDRLLETANYLKDGKFNPERSRAIVFVKSRRKVEECALLMPYSLKEVFGANCTFAEKVGSFHAGMDVEDRKDTYEKYRLGEIVVLFATKAFGMGMDLPNIHFVTHYSPPSTFEDFLQEVGRAGRNEKQRLEAGFDNAENPIKTLCLTYKNDFAKLKDQLHKSRLSWYEVKDIKLVVEEYIASFKPLIPDTEIPVAVPFNLYSKKMDFVNEDLDSKFRIALHWLERLERIKLGYFTITHLEFDTASLNTLGEQINKCPDRDCKIVCNAIIELLPISASSSKLTQLSITSLRSSSKLSLESLFTAILKGHKSGILKLQQDVVIEPTKFRFDETNHCKNVYYENEKYPALQIVFSLATKILSTVPLNGSELFEGEELDDFLKESINENTNFKKLPWSKKEETDGQIKEYEKYMQDVLKKRSKHAFTIIRLLSKAKHETKMDKVIDSTQKVRVVQSVFNGYHKKKEWLNEIKQLEKDCINLLDYIAKEYFDKNIRRFNWPDIISQLNLKANVQYFSDLLFILSVLGYIKTGGLLPSGIEVYLNSVENVDEGDLQSLDKRVFEEFEQTRKVRELKLIALEVMAGFQKVAGGKDETAVRKRQDAFIRKYFACSSMESLLQLLHDELPTNDPLLIKWRGEAIKAEEDSLNDEQRKVYDAPINQHISVMAGPGSGKTHTLTLRVARLVHHVGTNPEEILVLAYNRAVVSELKERLGKLFNDLGYGSLAKRIKIFTLHGLAKKYCPKEVADQPFDEWENILLRMLEWVPGHIMNQVGALKYILVDEFQDINNIRVGLLNKLHQLTDSYLFIIGDPNQSIYGYERKKTGGSISPWPYYKEFDQIFKPTPFELYDNRRSYPAILRLASQLLTLPAQHRYLIPRPTRVPDSNFIANYAQIIDRRQQRVDWWNQISNLMQERVGQRPYKQIAILFRTNNEVYRGFQKLKGLNLPNIRIRIQGSLPYEFTRIRECHEVILFLKSKLGQQIPLDFKRTFGVLINDLIDQNQNWNHFYLRVIHAIVLEYLDERDENQVFNDLLEFITELTYKDDGQLYKIYEKHFDNIAATTHETEIVLTTMHKVKGLEFDCVVIPPSFSNLPLKANAILSQEELTEQLDEEKRLAFVSYTRARYRLLIFKHEREIALDNNTRYLLPENANRNLGIPVQPEIKKLNIGWAAGNYIYNSGVNNYIRSQIKNGDFLYVKKRVVQNNGNPFTVHELFKEGTESAIGQLSRDAGSILQHSGCNGFIVNEVVVWSFEDTVKFDQENPGKNYSANWCEAARNQGYIYLVDFAGFGVPNDENV